LLKSCICKANMRRSAATGTGAGYPLSAARPGTPRHCHNDAQSCCNSVRARRPHGCAAAPREVLEASRRHLGMEHPSTLKVMDNLAGTLCAQGNMKRA
jgi:hypothetical protein